jgi:hypothetical protein
MISNKYFDIENYEIKFEKNKNEIFFTIRNKLSPFDIIYKNINSTIFNADLLYQIIYNCFIKKDDKYNIIIIKDRNIIKDIHFHMKINYFVDITFELYEKKNCIEHKSILSSDNSKNNNKLTKYSLYEKPIEEFDDKIYLFTYWKEYRFNFQEMINYYEYKDCKNLEIKDCFDYVNKIINPEYDSDMFDTYPDEKYRYHILYHDKYFHIQNISKLDKLECLNIDYYKYNDLNAFYNKTLKELTIGSYNTISYIKSINGISNFDVLSKITFINCFYLENIVNILQQEKNIIQELYFIYCHKIDFSELMTYCKEKRIKLNIRFCFI